MNKINFDNKAENVEINYSSNERKNNSNGERDLNGVKIILKFILNLQTRIYYLAIYWFFYWMFINSSIRRIIFIVKLKIFYVSNKFKSI